MDKHFNWQFKQEIEQIVQSIETNQLDLVVSYRLPDGSPCKISIYAVSKANVLRIGISLRRAAALKGITGLTIIPRLTNKPIFYNEESKED